MKNKILSRIIAFILILIIVPAFHACKKQPKCGCGKDMIFELTDAQALVQFNASTNTAIFYTATGGGSTYYFCNPGTWMDSLKKLNTQEYLLISGKAYYECNYLYQSGNSYYQVPPVYQVEVTGVREDNYGKK